MRNATKQSTPVTYSDHFELSFDSIPRPGSSHEPGTRRIDIDLWTSLGTIIHGSCGGDLSKTGPVGNISPHLFDIIVPLPRSMTVEQDNNSQQQQSTQQQSKEAKQQLRQKQKSQESQQKPKQSATNEVTNETLNQTGDINNSNNNKRMDKTNLSVRLFRRIITRSNGVDRSSSSSSSSKLIKNTNDPTYQASPSSLLPSSSSNTDGTRRNSSCISMSSSQSVSKNSDNKPQQLYKSQQQQRFVSRNSKQIFPLEAPSDLNLSSKFTSRPHLIPLAYKLRVRPIETKVTDIIGKLLNKYYSWLCHRLKNMIDEHLNLLNPKLAKKSDEFLNQIQSFYDKLTNGTLSLNANNYLLKICGQEQYLIGENPIHLFEVFINEILCIIFCYFNVSIFSIYEIVSPKIVLHN